jgi:hypothetical protein
MKITLTGVKEAQKFLKNLQKSIRRAQVSPRIPSRLPRIKIGNAPEHKYLESVFRVERRGNKIVTYFAQGTFVGDMSKDAPVAMTTQDVIERVKYGGPSVMRVNLQAVMIAYVRQHVMPKILRRMTDG